jgi:hypothetical protein
MVLPDGLRDHKERELPVAAVPAAATAATATTASAAMATATTASATTVAPAPATTAASTFTLRPCFVDDKRAAEEFPAIQGRDGLFSLRVVANLRKAEPARLTGESIAKERKRIRLHARFREQRRHLFFRSLER